MLKCPVKQLFEIILKIPKESTDCEDRPAAAA